MNGQFLNLIKYFFLEYYFYIKSLHIIFVITWFAGLFYTPRLFIYFLEATQKKNPDRKILMNQFKIMIYRLWYIITWPSSILALIFGIWLLVLNHQWLYETWMIVKLGLVILLVIYHIKTHFIQKELRKEIIKYSSYFMRIWNEVSSLVLFSVVFLVSLKNSINWTYLILSLICLIIIIVCLINYYRKVRDKNDKKT